MTQVPPPDGPCPDEVVARFSDEAPARRLLYVISDLHLGGPPDRDRPEARGFRLTTQGAVLARFLEALAGRPAGAPPLELVINGDFVDFLAEPEPADPPEWHPLRTDQAAAAAVLKRIVETREAAVFTALGRFVRAGHGLTVLLGNHDVELGYPAVRRELERALQVDRPGAVHYLLDGEAYVVGDQVLIEHGNRYDEFNQNDNDGLRRLRALQSRRQPPGDDADVQPSPGSSMVASVVNHIKPDHPFVDLLKPETEALYPLLLALNPSCRTHLGTVASLAQQARQAGMASPLVPKQARNIASPGRPTGRGQPAKLAGPVKAAAHADPLYEVLRRQLGDDLAEFLETLELPGPGRAGSGVRDIASGPLAKINYALGMFRLFWDGHYSKFEKRLPALWQALDRLRAESPFDWRQPPDGDYGKAVRELHANGFALVLFGHTHLARAAETPGGWYFNTGTWADLIPFPIHVRGLKRKEGLDKVRGFCDDLTKHHWSPWVRFLPTYARLALGEGDRLIEARLCRFDGTAVA
jgi:UDP-2,3-diacylglucosamine pyrophosphatase LpxH